MVGRSPDTAMGVLSSKKVISTLGPPSRVHWYILPVSVSSKFFLKLSLMASKGTPASTYYSQLFLIISGLSGTVGAKEGGVVLLEVGEAGAILGEGLEGGVELAEGGGNVSGAKVDGGEELVDGSNVAGVDGAGGV